MKIKRHDISKFSDLGTVVLYPTRTFHAEIQGNESEYIENIIKKSTTNSFLYSTALTSEYSDFAKYDFRFNLPETDYWSSIIPNFYEYQDTINKFGENFDSSSENLIPQLSPGNEKPEKHFFGKMSYSGNTIYLINIPREIKTLSNSLNDPKTVWKVEIYNERIATNNKRGYFIDYDILSMFSPEDILSEPIISVYFGPSWDTQIMDFTFGDLPEEYLSRYSHPALGGNCLTNEIYEEFDNYISEKDYSKLILEELGSDKILYIVNTTNGDIETIDMFSAGYSESNNKYRNLNTTTLRNDETSEYKILETHSGMVFDSRSSVILGLGGKVSDCPLFSERSNRISFSESSSPREVVVSGKTYIRPKNMEVFGENPEISPYWIAPDYLKKSMFNHYYINKTGGGSIEPSGVIYIRSDKFLEINAEADKGNRFFEIPGQSYVQNGNKLLLLYPENGSKINVVFRENIYDIDLKLICQKDYPNFGGYKEYPSVSLYDINVQLIYLDNLGNENIYAGEKMDISCSNPFKFRFNLENSLYKLPISPKFFFLNDPSLVLKKEGEYYVISVKEIPENILESQPIEIIGSIESKQYSVYIETSNEIQVSAKKRTILEYGDSFSADFYYDGNKDLNFIVINEDTKEIEDTGVWEITKIGEGYYNFSIQKRTQQNTAQGIKNNYRIIVSV